jgi:vancomycin resistance protein VanJ
MKRGFRKTRAVLRWTAAVVCWGAAALLTAGLALRVTVRDEWDFAAPLFYATPWLVLTVAALLCLVRWRKLRRARIVFAVLLATCAGMWAVKSFRFGPRERPAGSFRIAYWNVARPGWRLDGVLREVDRWGADVMAFGEQRWAKTVHPEWLSHFAPKHARVLERELFLVTPEAPKIAHGGSLGGRGGCEIATIRVQGREVFVLMVDFSSAPNRSRRPAFERLYQIVDAYAGKPLIVIGDFNTPADSVFFDRLRAKLSGAFESAGRGYAATWPMPLPVMQLDHIWTNKHVRVVRCEHLTSLYSDHRAVLADVVFP